PGQAEAELARVLGLQRRVAAPPGVDLVPDVAVLRAVGDVVAVGIDAALFRAVAHHHAGAVVGDVLGGERALAVHVGQRRGTEALAGGGAQGQVAQRLPAQRDLRGDVAAVVAVAVVARGQGDVEAARDREQPFGVRGVDLARARGR